MAEAFLIWHGPMLPPNDHSKPCKLCGEPIKVGQRFGLLRSPGYPGCKHHMCHVACFDEASGGVTPEREPVELPDLKPSNEPVDPTEIDVTDWK